MYNMNVSIGYYPRTKVIGLSKMARIADMVAKDFKFRKEWDLAFIVLCLLFYRLTM